jgi:predicted Zn-dependent peptidase
MDEMLNSIEKVTAAEVQQLAQDIFDPRHIALTVLGNLEGLRVGREELAC